MSRTILFRLLFVLLIPGPGWADRLEADRLEEAARAFSRGQFDLVIKHLADQLPDAEANLLRGRTLIKLGHYAEAQQSLEGLLPQLPHLRDLIFFLQGEALFGSGQYLSAAQKFREAARTKSSRWVYQSWRRRADALRAGGKPALAAAEYKHVLRIQPRTAVQPEIELALAFCLEKTGKRQNAARALQEIWLRWPNTSVAGQARQELDRLLAAGVRIPPPTVAKQMTRIRALQQGKYFPAALEELQTLQARVRKSPELTAQVNLERAYTLLKANQPAEALSLLRALARRRRLGASWLLRKMMADCLARLGHIEEGAALLLKNDVSTIKKLSRAQQAEIHRAATFRAAYGSYSEALKLYERLAALSPRANDLKLKVAWFSYRSGRYEKAAKQLEAWSKRAPRSKDFALYWMARAHARAGQTEKAEELYRLLLSSYGRSYYGLLARSRLGENRKIPRPASPKSCPEETSTAAPVTDSNSEVLPRLATLITRYVDLYPSLRRVQSLWRMGMISDAQRELRLIAIDAAWIKARGRSARYVQRPDVERLWRDGPLPQRRWGKRERQIFKEGAPLRYDLGLLMTKSGISYFGWQLSPPDEDPLRHQYPRAYHDVVIASAKRFKLDPYIIWAIMRTESQYRLDVISRVGATGLMQIMPQTGLRIAVLMKLNNFHRSQLFDPETNVLLAGWYLRALSDKFKNQLALVAAAYNGGPHHVARWLDQRGKNSNMDEFIEEIPFSESKRYAKKILRLVAQYLRIYCAKDDWVTSNALAIGYGAHPDF